MFEIYKKPIEKHEKKARELAENIYDEGFIKDFQPLVFDSARLDVDHIEFYEEKEAINISATIKQGDDEIAYIVSDIKIPFEVLIKCAVHSTNKSKELLSKAKDILDLEGEKE